jgi:hypothetical protein
MSHICVHEAAPCVTSAPTGARARLAQSAIRNPQSPPGDQAATLRQLFARRSARLLPVLLPQGAHEVRASWIARLAQGFARQGERTLLVDATRLQIAAALGLRARFDLAHVLNGDCALDAALLDAGINLAVLPAACALAQPQGAVRLLHQLSVLGQAKVDLVLLLLPPSVCAHLPDCDVLVTLLPDAQDLNAQLSTLQHADRALAQRAEIPVTGRFRLLFLAMGAGPASTLARRLEKKIIMSGSMSMDFAGSARVACDLAEVVRAAAGWATGRLADPAPANGSTE